MQRRLHVDCRKRVIACGVLRSFNLKSAAAVAAKSSISQSQIQRFNCIPFERNQTSAPPDICPPVDINIADILLPSSGEELELV